MNYRVRFHLAPGRNHQKFQVRHPDGQVTYHDPTHTQIIMKNCRLRNQKKTAEAICAGKNKTVCAWVDADSVDFAPHQTVSVADNTISFNPRVVPYWTNQAQQNLDNHTYSKIITLGRILHTQ